MPTRCGLRRGRRLHARSNRKPRYRLVAGFSLSVCLALVSSLSSAEGLAVSAPVAAVDDRPPAPVSYLRAADRPGDEGGHIVLSWVLSPDDRVVFRSMVPGTYEPASGQAVTYGRRGLEGYRIYRCQEGRDSIMIETLPAGTDTYLDGQVQDGLNYSYEVRAFDSRYETGPDIALGSAADQARTTRARDDREQPVDAAGRPVLGWYDRGDPTVGLDDFFLFADHFGRVEGETAFDPQYDLDGDRRIGFSDFFLFADHFGAVVANYAQLTGQ